MSEEKSQILIVEDDLDLAEMLNSYFRVQGYEVLTAAWGNDAVRITQESMPDLIVLDIRLPDIDGFEVCRQVRSNRRTANLPVIFLTEKRDRVDKLAGLELGVVDYITKPFDLQELRLRVRNALERTKPSHYLNPVTNLPKDHLTDIQLEQLIRAESPWAIMTIRIVGLNEFREQYGFVASDDVLRAVTLMMSQAVRDEHANNDFIGHFQEQYFVVITETKRVKAIQERIEKRLDQSFPYFYPFNKREEVTKLPEDQQLHIVTNIITPEDGLYTELDDLKKAILRIV